MRPQSIVQFEMIFFILIATTAAAQLLDLGRQPSPAMLLVVLAIWALVNLALWYLIARRGNSAARWIYAGLFVLGLAGLLVAGMGGMIAGGLAAVSGIALVMLNALSVWLLFRPDTAEWFNGKPSDEADAPQP